MSESGLRHPGGTLTAENAELRAEVATLRSQIKVWRDRCLAAEATRHPRAPAGAADLEAELSAARLEARKWKDFARAWEDRSKRAFREKQRQLSEAEGALGAALLAGSGPVRELRARVERRRAELEEYRHLMTSAPGASSQHRGTKSYRPAS